MADAVGDGVVARGHAHGAEKVSAKGAFGHSRFGGDFGVIEVGAGSGEAGEAFFEPCGGDAGAGAFFGEFGEEGFEGEGGAGALPAVGLDGEGEQFVEALAVVAGGGRNLRGDREEAGVEPGVDDFAAEGEVAVEPAFGAGGGMEADARAGVAGPEMAAF